MRKGLVCILALVFLGLTAGVGLAGYQHNGEKDLAVFETAYPFVKGTKLDQCTTCHSGGKSGKSTFGSCQWCHFTTSYGTTGDYLDTLNSYGLAYNGAGRNAAALQTIESIDSDGDGYTNIDEINTLHYPGDATDDPTKVAAPSRILSRKQLLALPQHSQFLLMNTSRSGDYYATYSGVPMAKVLKTAGMTAEAKSITVFSPDGFSTAHPFYEDWTPGSNLYHIYGTYPMALYHYDATADIALNPSPAGWCDYSAPSAAGRKDGDLIFNSGGLQMMLAIKRDGGLLVSGYLDQTNKLQGEGPFRVVPPQKVPSPPDQSSTAANQSVIWPYTSTWDHNAGFSTRTVTIIRIEPLPKGTTDINFMEAGWNCVDNNTIVVYGAIDPASSAVDKLTTLASTIKGLPLTAFKSPNRALKKSTLISEVQSALQKAQNGSAKKASGILSTKVLVRTDGYITGSGPDSTDWIVDSTAQKAVYYPTNEIITLLGQ